MAVGISGVWFISRSCKRSEAFSEVEDDEEPKVEVSQCIWFSGTSEQCYHTSRKCVYLNKKNSRAPREIPLCTECAKDYKYITHG